MCHFNSTCRQRVHTAPDSAGRHPVDEEFFDHTGETTTAVVEPTHAPLDGNHIVC